MTLQDIRAIARSLPQQFVTSLDTYSPTDQSVKKPNPFGVYEQRVTDARKELQESLRAAGTEPRKHTLEDFTQAILVQLDMQLEGQNPTATEILRYAFPGDSDKATSLGKSQNRNLWKHAYDSAAVTTHPVSVELRKHVGTRDMNLRHNTRSFAHSLSAATLLYQLGVAIHALGEQKEELDLNKRRGTASEHIHTGRATSRKEAIFALRDSGMGRSEIARTLEMNLNTVNYHLRTRNSGESTV